MSLINTPRYYIEVGGRKKGCSPKKPIFQDGGSGVVINVECFPNPYKYITTYKSLDETPEAIEKWILDKGYNTKWKQCIDQGINALSVGKPIRVECWGGKHRSVSLANAIVREAKLRVQQSPDWKNLKPIILDSHF